MTGEDAAVLAAFRQDLELLSDVRAFASTGNVYAWFSDDTMEILRTPEETT